MQSFLEKTVKHLHQKYGDEMGELCIVLPNRRAGLFLKTHIANTAKQHTWAPEVFAIEDFVELLSGLDIADNITLLFELYETVKKVKGKDADSFDEFAKWGQVLLGDINEIDRYLVDAKQLFGNLKNIKELDTWSLNHEEELTDFQQQYLTFWKSLGEYYFDFKQRLLDKRIAYQGLAYQVVAKSATERIGKQKWKKVIFAGFNALNKAEEHIITQLLNSGHAEIIWDSDSYYVNDLRQEAGRFLRKHESSGRFTKAEDKNYSFQETLLSTGEKNIKIIGAAKNVAQAKVAGNIIADLKDKGADLQNTALVLADENLLFPVLHSLPESLTDINITMGYPLGSTPLAGYFDLIFNLHINAIKISKGAKKYSFYHRDFLNLLNNPYTRVLLDSEIGVRALKRMVKQIKSQNRLFISHSFLEQLYEDLGEEGRAILTSLFSHWATPDDALTCIQAMIEGLKNTIIKQQEGKGKPTVSLDLEYLFAFTKIIKRIKVLMKDYPDSIASLPILHSMVKQIVRATSLPFYGEPLKGLQIMGMLETRTLDFENIILLSCNENVLPAGKSTNSFIPYDLKFHFGLPTYGDKDAIFAYHFYRLIQRATNLHLVYNTENDALGSGEKSRFLTQLIHELPKVNNNVSIIESLVSIPIQDNANENCISIDKTGAILAQLNVIADKGFSPSLLNIYRNCSLQFYFKSIARLSEIDDVKESIGADTLGNAVHKVLEELYLPFVGKKMKVEDIQQMKKQVEPLTISAFEKEYNIKEIQQGKNLLTLKVALKFLRNYLNSEIGIIKQAELDKTPLIIHALEEKLEANVLVNDKMVQLHGNADRIDGLGSLLRIIDYKTGVVDEKELKLGDMSELLNDTAFNKSFQLLMYAWMYQKGHPNVKDNLVSGIVTFRNISAGLKTVQINKEQFLKEDILAGFESQLIHLLSEVLNPDISFSQTPDVNNCSYCNYKGICGR